MTDSKTPSPPKEWCIGQHDPRLRPVLFANRGVALAHGWPPEELTDVIEKVAPDDAERIRQAAVKCLAEELKAILNIVPTEVNGKQRIIFEADRAPEILRRIEQYEQLALGGKA